MKRGYTAQAGPELKIVDIANNTSIIPTGAIVPFPIPQEGSAFYNRIGRRVANRSIQFKGEIKPTFTNAAAKWRLYNRLVLVYDRQPNGAYPAASDVLAGYTSAGVTTTTEKSMPNPNNKDRFVILKDHVMMTEPIGISGAPSAAGLDVTLNNLYEINWFVKLRGLETVLKASTGLIGDVTTGALFLLVINNDPVGASPAWKIELYTRLRFTD